MAVDAERHTVMASEGARQVYAMHAGFGGCGADAELGRLDRRVPHPAEPARRQAARGLLAGCRTRDQVRAEQRRFRGHALVEQCAQDLVEAAGMSGAPLRHGKGKGVVIDPGQVQREDQRAAGAPAIAARSVPAGLRQAEFAIGACSRRP